MKNKDFRDKELKMKLISYRDKGKETLEWKLSKEQLELIRSWGYRVEPYLYQITTKQFWNINKLKSSLLRDIHFAYKKGKKTYVTSLKKSDEIILKDNGVKYTIAKYRIYLKRK